MSKKILISGYYGFDNFGDETILDILVKHLKTPDTQITVFSANPDKTANRLKIDTIHSFNYKKVLENILKTDFLISGGGSLLQDVTSLKSLMYYLGIIFIAILFHKKVIIFAQGIGPINNKFARFLTLSLLKQCCYVSVRDKVSYEFLHKNGIKSELVCDPVFSLNTPIVNNNGIVGIQLRNFKTMNNTFLNELAHNINVHFSNKKIQLFVLQQENDFEISKKFQNILRGINRNLQIEIISGISNEEIIKYLSNLEYLIAMRFHAILIALKSQVKTVAINYDIKVQNLATEMNIPLLSLNLGNNYEQIFTDMKNINVDKINSKIKTKTFNWTIIDSLINNK